MTFLRRRLIVGLAAFLAPLLVAPAQAQDRGLLVYAASSLTDALNEIATAYAATGQPKPVFSYAASSVLARQIEQGARADMFLSADEDWMNYLADRSLIDPATRTNFVANKLVLVAPAGKTVSLKIGRNFPLKRGLNGGKLAMADPDSVPAGKYGRAALENLGVWASVQTVVARAENVRAALRFVETGDAPFGIVYLTDARASGAKVQVVGEFPAASHAPIVYPLAVVKGGDPRAKAFSAFLLSAPARAIFTKHGFSFPQ